MCKRFLLSTDLWTIADYLVGTRASLRTAISELGFDPTQYPKIREWLCCELGLQQNKKTHLWFYKE